MARNPKSLRTINVVDFEATCWDNDDEKDDQPMEIIEFGIVQIRFNDGGWQLQRHVPLSFYVKPRWSTVSGFCTSLTGIQPQHLRDAHHLPRVIKDVNKAGYALAKYPWASWGNYDAKQMLRDCARHGITYPFSGSHINVKDQHAFTTGKSRGIGLSNALKEMGMEFIGDPHKAYDDAFNVARVLVEILNRRLK